MGGELGGFGFLGWVPLGLRGRSCDVVNYRRPWHRTLVMRSVGWIFWLVGFGQRKLSGAAFFLETETFAADVDHGGVVTGRIVVVFLAEL